MLVLISHKLLLAEVLILLQLGICIMSIGHLDDESNELIMQMSYCNNTMIRKTECQNGHYVSTAKDLFKGLHVF